MTAGGWPLAGKAHIGHDHSLAHWSRPVRMSAAWNVIQVLSTEWSLWRQSGQLWLRLAANKADICAPGTVEHESRGVIRSWARVTPDGRSYSSAGPLWLGRTGLLVLPFAPGRANVPPAGV